MNSEDDDISAFGADAVDVSVVCTTNEYRLDGWVFIKNEFPFHDRDMQGIQWDFFLKPSVIGCTLRDGRYIHANDDVDKRVVLTAAQDVVYARAQAKREQIEKQNKALIHEVTSVHLVTDNSLGEMLLQTLADVWHPGPKE